MATSPKSAPTATDVEEQIRTIRNDISTLTELLKDLAGSKAEDVRKTASNEADDLLRRSKETAEEASARAKQAVGSVEDYISEKPVQSALIALLVGILIGSFSRK